MTKTAVADPSYVPTAPYSPAIRAGSMLFLSGQVGVDPATGQILPDAGSQFRQCLMNVVRVVEAGGYTLDDVVRTTVYLTDADDFALFNEVYRDVFVEPRPARSTVVVAALPFPGMRIMVDAIATG
jgi:2-iminobutanoate/2-iminopropanoate deaminase